MHLTSKSILKEVLEKYQDLLLESPTNKEYRVVINLIEMELMRKEKLTPKEAKKEYLQIYYLKNKDKLNKRYCQQSKKIREQSKLYEEAVRNGGL